MSTKTKSIIVVLAFGGLVVAAWACSGMLWRLLLAMHGQHHH